MSAKANNRKILHDAAPLDSGSLPERIPGNSPHKISDELTSAMERYHFRYKSSNILLSQASQLAVHRCCKSLAASLENNTSLKELILEYDDVDYEDEEPLTTQAWSAFSSVLCRKSSIMATFSSNHTLQELELPGVPREVASLLKMNKKSNVKAARLKIINTFSGDFDVRPFVEMDIKVLPRAVAWMARGSTLNGMYQVVKCTIGIEV
ncbi:hypothetical protein ACHAWF_009581 [Thalassiosira exigua]